MEKQGSDASGANGRGPVGWGLLLTGAAIAVWMIVSGVRGGLAGDPDDGPTSTVGTVDESTAP